MKAIHPEATMPPLNTLSHPNSNHSGSSARSNNNNSQRDTTTTTNGRLPQHHLRNRSFQSEMALSRAETVIVSASGDVLVSRCRNSPYPQNGVAGDSSAYPMEACQNDVAVMCCDVECDDLSMNAQDYAPCTPWGNGATGSPTAGSTSSHTKTRSALSTSNNSSGRGRGGLLGGAPAADVASPLHHPHHAGLNRQDLFTGDNGATTNGGPTVLATTNQKKNSDTDVAAANGNHMPPDSPGGRVSLKDRAQLAFRSPPIGNVGTGFDEESIVPIRSFDYSHFREGGNDMVPEMRRPVSRLSNMSSSAEAGGGAAPTDNTATTNPSHNASMTTTASTAASTAMTTRSSSPFRSHNATATNTDYRNTISRTAATEGRGAPRGKPNSVPPTHFIHGVPSFVPAFSQVKITKVSANPLGAHVLLISNAGLLYSYGLNDYGQLGIGLTTNPSGFHRGFVATPTIVTPLVENGGKAIACAAGVSHSLVVVATEERRLVRSQEQSDLPHAAPVNVGSSGALTMDGSSTAESIIHHQLYGFGRNDYMKIGLVSPKLPKANPKGRDMDVCKLPRRVALRCKVKPASSRQSFSSMEPLHHNQFHHEPPLGIFAIAASAEHSAALVQRATGDVELYTWGNATHGALGLPQHPPSMSEMDALTGGRYHHHHKNSISPSTNAVRVAPVPSFVASLSRTSNAGARVNSLLIREVGEYPSSLALGKKCSFVTTSLGRCFSFGVSDEGMLGQGAKMTEIHKPTEICFPREAQDEHLVSVSAGASHVVALARSGNAYAWGSRLPAGLSRNKITVHNSSPPSDSNTKAVVAESAEVEELDVAWSPERVYMPTEARTGEPCQRIVKVCAGLDLSLFVVDSGHVFSCGKNSGRLGLGEQNNHVDIPRPLFGGLRLWQERRQQLYHALTLQQQPIQQQQRWSVATTRQQSPQRDRQQQPPSKPILRRGVTLS